MLLNILGDPPSFDFLSLSQGLFDSFLPPGVIDFLFEFLHFLSTFEFFHEPFLELPAEPYADRFVSPR